MIYISKTEFNKLISKHPDYICKCTARHEYNGKVCLPGEYMCIEGCLTGDYSKGSVLIFQHIHFEIV